MKRLPLFDEKFSEKTLRPQIQRIAKLVFDERQSVTQPGWLTGMAGLAVFSAEYQAWHKPIHAITPYTTILQNILSLIDRGFSFPSFAAGLAGIHWTFKYLGQRNFISLEEAEALSPLIPYIMKWAQTQQENHNHDILHGSLGPLYAIARAELQFGPCPHTHNPPVGHITDLGLAHGILGQALAKNQAQQNDIIDDLRYLLSQADWSMRQGSVFPTKIVDGKPIFPSRMAWCYGDPGIGIALMQLETDYEELKGAGERVLTLAATRRDPENTRVDDPFICHGSAGLALIFFKGWLLSNNDKLREAARYWTKATIEFLEEVRGPKSGVRSPKSGDGMNDWPVSVLDGLSGIGLVLMAIDQGHLPGWEKGLFI